MARKSKKKKLMTAVGEKNNIKLYMNNSSIINVTFGMNTEKTNLRLFIIGVLFAKTAIMDVTYLC